MNTEDRKVRQRAYQRAYHQRPDVRARLNARKRAERAAETPTQREARLIKRRYADRERRSRNVESFIELSRGDHSADQRNPRAHVRAHETKLEEVSR